MLAGADEVIDLAYSTAPQTSFADPIFDIVSNLPASVGLLQESLAAGIRKVVLVSSGGTVYGVARSLPIREDHATRPISPYGITKLAIENYGWMFKALSNLPVVVVRPANAYGEGQRTLSGQGFIAAAMHSITEGHAVDVFGESGTVRDYIHVTDVAAGIVAALESGVPGMAYNIGTSEGRTNIEILEMIKPLAAAAGLGVKIRHLPARNFDVPANCLDSGRLRSISGWRPRVSLQDGIRRLWDGAMEGNRH
jgi:UDP-glucose 4-epimerase